LGEMAMRAEEMIQTMAKQGMRITDQRRTLSELFAGGDGFLTAKDVYAHMGKTYAGLSFDTVYRNLRVMVDMGILEQVVFEDGVKFRVHCHEDDHHHHVICLNCEKTYPVVFCPMQHVDGLPEGFEVVKHKFDIFGYCPECRPTPS
jgi:Fur family zinc uptake transcriptional regulator